MGESVDNCLNLDGVSALIHLPTGCAEQTMSTMSPAINAIKFMDATDQWINLNAARREEAKSMIKSGKPHQYSTAMIQSGKPHQYSTAQCTVTVCIA